MFREVFSSPERRTERPIPLDHLCPEARDDGPRPSPRARLAMIMAINGVLWGAIWWALFG